jgi:hypothetical protein
MTDDRDTVDLEIPHTCRINPHLGVSESEVALTVGPPVFFPGRKPGQQLTG